MKKKLHYLGAHSRTGSSVGFAGWGNGKSRRPKVGLAGMSPAIYPGSQFTLLKASVVAAKFKKKTRCKKKTNADRT